ncbi:MAG: hypothetical protein CM15mP70_10750 [Pelagibacteraceae bacterium]|nr:MAG: hypothetical protein CM15mP70_10750 [Pelagibacteraceae bacterium]
MVYLRNETKRSIEIWSHGPKTFENLTVIDGQIEVSVEKQKKNYQKVILFVFNQIREHILKISQNKKLKY